MSTILKPINTAKRLFVYFLLSMIISSCQNSEPTITALNLLYECQGPLVDQNKTREFIVSLQGTKDYVAKDGSSQTHSFVFKTPNDFIEICIADRAQVDPGKSYDLLLIHVDKNGDFIGSKSKWPLHVANTTGQLIRDFCFKIQPNNGDLSILPDTPVGGIWRILRTDREIAVNYRTRIKSAIESKSSSPSNCGP